MFHTCDQYDKVRPKGRGLHIAIPRTYRSEFQEHKGELGDKEHPPSHTCVPRWSVRDAPPHTATATRTPPHFNMLAYVGIHDAAVKTDTISPPMYAGKGSA